VAALVNEVQLTHVKADFSCTSLTNDPIGFAREVSIRDVYTAYPFANVSVLKQITGRTLKLALERCASYLELADGKPVISDRFLKPKIEHYNYDFYAGIDYAFDLRRPLGDRVVRLLRLDGTPIEEDGQYTLVCSDYRASRTGGYEMIGESPVLWTGADNMQDLLIGYIREHALIKPAENVRFRVIWQ
jgi:2',3'-cyclic-nucleotide 2'-phosphodiesterase/3'-nucleotidase